MGLQGMVRSTVAALVGVLSSFVAMGAQPAFTDRRSDASS
jgi:hypothetical protein